MFGLGPVELILILGIILIIFGAGKLPSAGAAIGKSIKEFRSASEDTTTTTTTTVTAPVTAPVTATKDTNI